MTPASAYGIVLEYRGAHIIIIITPEYIVSSRLLARVQFTLIHLSIEKLTWRTTGLSTQVNNPTVLRSICSVGILIFSTPCAISRCSFCYCYCKCWYSTYSRVCLTTRSRDPESSSPARPHGYGGLGAPASYLEVATPENTSCPSALSSILRESASKLVLRRMWLTLHATRRTPHGACFALF